ncbi:MAG: glycosyltransferase [Crocinitomicaceae bacterium]|nr:glycosyltransferase [Crocinitomicaceae bacterium]
MRKIKVLRIINRFNIGGPTYNATFLTAFLGEKYETMLVGGLPDVGESDSLYILEQYGVKPQLIKEMVRQPNIKSDREAYQKLKQIIEEFKPDIVHTHASKAGALGRKAAAACNVPIIIHTFHGHVFHSYFGRVKTSIFKAIEKNLAKKSDAIIAISNIQKNELTQEHKICSADKVRVVPLGFDLQSFHDKRISERENTRKKYGIEPDEIAIGIIGRLAPIKNHDYFLDVIEQVFDQADEKIKCFIVGDGPERESIILRVNEINKKGNNSIQLTSWISDIGTFNAGMDLICLTSKNEGTPVSLIEAQAGGIPVVTTEVGGVKDIVLEGETGFIVPADNKKMFVEKVLELVNDEKKREKMSQNGWNYVRERFHYTTLVRNMDALYTELIEKKIK